MSWGVRLGQKGFSDAVLRGELEIKWRLKSSSSTLPPQGNLSELGKLLMQGSFSVWTEHKKGHAKVKDLARFKPMQRHLFLHEKAMLFCKRREENGEGYEKAPSYSFKHSLSVSPPQSRMKASWSQSGNRFLTCFSFSPCSQRWALSGSLRTQRGTTRSLKYGATPERRFTSSRYLMGF